MTRQEIEKNTIQFLRTAGGTRPDLRVVDTGNGRVVVKDFRRSDLLFRLVIGPILIRREYGALAKLRGVKGVPQLIRKIDRFAYVMEHVDGTSIGAFKGTLAENYFSRLEDILKNVHERGVTHCDLRSSGNAMVAADGSPYLVDFAACCFRGRGLNPFISFLFRQFIDADNYAVLILKRKHAPERLTPEELARLEAGMPYERIAVGFGKGVRNLTRRFLTRKSKKTTV